MSVDQSIFFIQNILLFLLISTLPTCFGWLKTSEDSEEKPTERSLGGNETRRDTRNKSMRKLNKIIPKSINKQENKAAILKKKKEDSEKLKEVENDRMEEDKKRDEEEEEDRKKRRQLEDEEDLKKTSSVESVNGKELKVDEDGFYVDEDAEDPTHREEKVGKQTGRATYAMRRRWAELQEL